MGRYWCSANLKWAEICREFRALLNALVRKENEMNLTGCDDCVVWLERGFAPFSEILSRIEEVVVKQFRPLT